MLRLVFFACLYQRSKGALHPFLHGGHSLRVPLQPQKETSVRSFNALHDSRRTEGADPHPRRGGVHRLMVDAVGQQLVAAHETVQKRAGKHPGGMVGGITVFIVTVVLPGGFGALAGYVLNQGSPSATLSICSPRQMPRTGFPVSMTAFSSASSNSSLAGVGVPHSGRMDWP